MNALLAGKIDIAWNTNLAYVRTFHATHGACRVLAMRDTDVEFFTILVGRAGAFSGVEDVRGTNARARQRGLGAGGDHARPLPGATRDSAGRGRRRWCGSTPTSASTATRAAASARRWRRCSTVGPTPPRWGRRRGTSSCAPGEVPPGRAGAVLDVAAVLALQLHGDAVAGRRGRGRVGRRTCARWTGRTRSIGGSSSSRGCANGSVRSSTATATCSPPSRSRGSRRDGERSGRRATSRVARYDGEASASPAG